MGGKVIAKLGRFVVLERRTSSKEAKEEKRVGVYIFV